MGLSPLLFIHFWLFFFFRAKNDCKEFVLNLFVYQAFEPNSIKNIGVLKIQNQSTQKQNKLGKHKIMKTCQTPGFDGFLLVFLCFAFVVFSGDSSFIHFWHRQSTYFLWGPSCLLHKDVKGFYWILFFFRCVCVKPNQTLSNHIRLSHCSPQIVFDII